jgi:hypothetical protein
MPSGGLRDGPAGRVVYPGEASERGLTVAERRTRPDDDVGGYRALTEWLAATRALSRRRVLAASAMAVPVAATASCGVPDLLAPPPGPSPSVRMLRAAITAEQSLVDAYAHVTAAYPELAAMLRPFRTQHDDHLAQLRGRLIIPPHVRTTPPPSPSPTGPVTRPASARAAITLLADAERGAAAAQLGRLGTATPSLAQLLASIAASEATHAVALSALTQAGG